MEFLSESVLKTPSMPPYEPKSQGFWTSPSHPPYENGNEPTVQDITAFLFEIMKDDLQLINNPKFSFFKYLDQKLSRLEQTNTASTTPTEIAVTPMSTGNAELIFSPGKSGTGTPKFIGSEDYTQTKTNYYTEPSIGIHIILLISLIGMLSPQPKRNRNSTIHSLPISEDQNHQTHENHPQLHSSNPDDSLYEDEVVINGPIFCDEKPSLMNQVNTPRIGPAQPSPDPITNCAPPLPAQIEKPIVKNKDKPPENTASKMSIPKSEIIKIADPIIINKDPIIRPTNKSLYYLDNINISSNGIFIMASTLPPQAPQPLQQKMVTISPPKPEPLPAQITPGISSATKVILQLPLNSPKISRDSLKKTSESAKKQMDLIETEKKYMRYAQTIIQRVFL